MPKVKKSRKDLKKKLTNSNRLTHQILETFFLLKQKYVQGLSLSSLSVLTLLIAGCASQTQWGSSVIPELQPTLRTSFDQLRQRDKACPNTMIATLTIKYSSPLQTKSVSGDLQFSLPENYKFIVTNPLGQLFWAVAGNRKHYQILNTTEQLYTSGGVESLILRNQLPLFLLHNNWGEWLMARNQTERLKITDIREDPAGRGIWFVTKDTLHGTYEHLLVNTDQQNLLQRILSGRDKEQFATITYSKIPKRDDLTQCVQPGHISITGLDYGSSIELEFSEIEFQREQSQYTLMKPPLYRQKSLP